MRPTKMLAWHRMGGSAWVAPLSRAVIPGDKPLPRAVFWKSRPMPPGSDIFPLLSFVFCPLENLRPMQPYTSKAKELLRHLTPLVEWRGREESVVKLVDVYGVLTVLPGLARDYTKQEFARDLYLLDQSGVVTTKNGRTLSLPASALTRGSGVLTTVSRSGQAKVYAGIALTAGSR